MTTTAKKLFTACSLVCLLGCKPKEISTSGQIFIVTQGAENINLGAVEVDLIEKHQVEDFLKDRQKEIVLKLDADRKWRDEAAAAANVAKTNLTVAESNYRATMNKLPSDLDIALIRQQIAALKNKRSALVANWATLQREISETRLPDSLTDLQEPLQKQILLNSNSISLLVKKLEQHEAYSEASKHVQEASDMLSAAESKAEKVQNTPFRYPTVDDYMVGFKPAVTMRVVTDADGRFSMTYPRDQAYSLMATATRRVMDKMEDYFWLIDAPTNSPDPKIILSIVNLSSLDPDNYFPVKPIEKSEDEKQPDANSPTP
jgi:hypothetical protein